ncbi:MAG TPA: hypothetical protein VJ949_10570 [Cryomorphaceae bacterium]|nr:hypothetical protein [Cryomorphaceae bacterium]
MQGVEGKFNFKGGRRLKGTFRLSSERKKRKEGKKKWKPVTWSGKLNDHKIEIVQLCDLPTTIEDFTWKKFPEKYEVVKAYIADAIEQYISEPEKD